MCYDNHYELVLTFFLVVTVAQSSGFGGGGGVGACQKFGYGCRVLSLVNPKMEFFDFHTLHAFNSHIIPLFDPV